MNLLKEIMTELLSDRECDIRFNIAGEDLVKAVDLICFKALGRIKEIVKNEDLSDFEAVEEIVRVFEELNIDCGTRHDFG